MKEAEEHPMIGIAEGSEGDDDEDGSAPTSNQQFWQPGPTMTSFTASPSC